jgi:RNA polymerase sigma factor (sigma-70 family)
MESNNKDPHKFKQAFDLYYKRIKTIAFKIVRNEEDADDIASQSFVKLWQYRDVEGWTLEAIYSLLKVIARNIAIDYWRKDPGTRYLDPSKAKDEQSFEMEFGHESARADDHELKEEITMELIKELVPKLPDRTREVFSLRFYEKKSAHQVAKQLGISVHTVNNINSEARKKLKKMIDERRGKK